MKKSILILILCIYTGLAFGQTPTTPSAKPPKEQYKTDPTKPLTITMTFTVPFGTVDGYLFVEQQGGVQAIQGSDRLTGAQIKQLTALHQSVADSLLQSVYKRYITFLKADQAKFSADTLKKYHSNK